MDNDSSDTSIESRPPTIDDLVKLCKSLNDKNVKYIVVGGMAMINAGLVRATVDIDLLVDSSTGNIEKLKEALSYLPDKAVNDVESEDIENYTVVKVADEIVIDLMKAACGVSYDEGSKLIDRIKVNDVEIPFPTLELLYKTKQTLREKDKLDKLFLEGKLKNKE